MKKIQGKRESFIPLHDNVLVKQWPEVDSGKTVRPDDDPSKELFRGVVEEVPEYGKLTQTGATVPSSIKMGDMIIFNKLRGQEVQINGEEFIIIKEDWILGKIN